MADNFNIWLAAPSQWIKQDGRARGGWNIRFDGRYSYYEPGDAPRKVAGPFQEPAEAADAAEEVLRRVGIAGQSYVELRYNGDNQAHTTIFLLEKEGQECTYGVWNSDNAPWPIFYPEGNPYGEMLDGIPEGFMPEEDADEAHDDENSDGFGDTDEDSKLMDLSNDGSEDSEDDDSEDEMDDDESDDDTGDDDENDPDEDEINTDDDSDSEDAEDDENGDPEEDEDGDDEEEVEMPRLNLFAKMKGPKGWRKRAEAEELLDRNVFGFKVGVLNPDGDTPGQQEKDVRVHVDFIETDDSRGSGVLRMRLPKSVTLDDFKQTGGGWIVVNVPYVDADDA